MFGIDVGLVYFLMFIFWFGIMFKYCDSVRDFYWYVSVVGDGFIKEYCVRWGIFIMSNW